jgi:hypothetical protein
MERQATTPLPGWILVANVPPAAFALSLVLLAIAAGQPDLEGLGWIAAAMVVDMFALPLAIPCLALSIVRLRSGQAGQHRSAATVAIVGNAITLFVPSAVLLYAAL